MAIVQLIRMLSKNNLTTYQMNSPQVFAYESDQFHRIFLEYLIIEERSIQIRGHQGSLNEMKFCTSKLNTKC